MKKKIWIITLFPEYFDAFKSQGKASSAFKESVDLHILNLRDYSDNSYKSVDDYPFGGGEGMVIRADVLKRALDSIDSPKLTVIYPSPRGKKWNADAAKSYAPEGDLVFICGRYEGIDERFIQKYVDVQYSLGDFVLTGGEIPTMAMIDSIVRFIPGTLGNENSSKNESFENNLLEHSHYTRPRVFEDMEVPEVLLSGHHKKIEEFRAKESQELTKKYRPDLLENL